LGEGAPTLKWVKKGVFWGELTPRWDPPKPKERGFPKKKNGPLKVWKGITN